MTRRTKNLIDHLAGLVPGYRGYAERDQRRATDKLLRESVASRLVRALADIDDALLRRIDAGELRGLDALDQLKREIGACADAFRHAPSGGSGLMDDVVVRADDLDRVHQHDLHVEQLAAELAAATAAAAHADDIVALLSLRTRVRELRDMVAERAEVLSRTFS